MANRWCVDADAAPQAQLESAAEAIRRGGVVAYPTDTLYGLAADPWNPRAVERLFAIKRRAADRAVPLIAASREQVETMLGALPQQTGRVAHAFWPGPLTLILDAPRTLPQALLGDSRTVAVRVPAHAVARALSSLVGVPLTATSANLSGGDATNDPDRVWRELGDMVDGLLDAGMSPGGPPSTIVEAAGASIRLVRAGAVSFDRVVQFLSS